MRGPGSWGFALRLVTTAFCLLASRVALRASSVSVYFSPHPDDWQLFMNPVPHADAHRVNSKVVFFYVTAGDGGNGNGPAGVRTPYYLARENAAKSSLRFVVDGEQVPAEAIATTVVINGHRVAQSIYKNTVSYFLRLTDGSIAGNGYASTGWQSLERLRKQEIPTLDAVDGSTVYYGWQDLVATVRELIRMEAGDGCAATVNLPDPDFPWNAGDHPDHLATGRLGQDATAALFRRRYFVGYGSASMPDNLGKDDLLIETATFAHVVAGINAAGYAAPWDATHRAWLGKSHFRLEPGASAACGAVGPAGCGPASPSIGPGDGFWVAPPGQRRCPAVDSCCTGWF
jgi:hypothetical protein